MLWMLPREESSLEEENLPELRIIDDGSGISKEMLKSNGKRDSSGHAVNERKWGSGERRCERREEKRKDKKKKLKIRTGGREEKR